ncbi:AmmeMemoRadiSam system protein B [Sedimenticola selenatireducens]|uniref:MEMO1 family protein FHP88_00205 n=1 Tax=Sedimenticola selenatireducens TaxID=191960 RepID=A0A558E1H9_9GAMM|nr:AmmeMemoRadiSam system protein B [Sedimenticola selenatireducens]TVO79021.1 AmmeMemoRadiSam system protein B [Sedimenticola selenatireducens]TVT67187.1 MAG: AmmeMemoRadiSam system protein B [Sedimenticola selenatireducens]
MQTIKTPAVAGLFYPADPALLHQDIQHFLTSAHRATTSHPKALIAPHAGYVYSGPIAGSAYASLDATSRDKINRVIILAPAHRVAFRGIAYSSATHFQTPLGLIPVNLSALSLITDLPMVTKNNEAFQDEHSIEVHLPFLQEILDEFSIVPLLVGEASAEQVATVLEQLWGGSETLVVISSDLSHYLDYESARKMDQDTSQAIETLQPGALTYHSACGRTPISGLLLCAKRYGLNVNTLDLRNSGDTAGSHDRVVGYGAYAFS